MSKTLLAPLLAAVTVAVVGAASILSDGTKEASYYFGFANGSRKSSADELRQGAAIGARLLRTDAQWADMEPERGRYDWDAWDAQIAAATTAGSKLIACVAYTPSWARPSGTSIFHAPADEFEADFARFVGAFADRYAESGVLVAVEIWNEPNIVTFWQPKPDPAKYVRMLKLAYAAVKRAAPGLEVVSAGLSPHGDYGSWPVGGDRINPVRYLEAMYEAGAGGSFDAVGWHPYDFADAPAGGPGGTGTSNTWHQMAWSTPSARSLMEAHGDGGKRIHATEFGVPSWGSAFGETFSEEKQRWQIERAVRLWKRYPWAGHLAVYLQRDGMNGGDGTWFFHHGLLYADGNEKPTWFAYRDAIAG